MDLKRPRKLNLNAPLLSTRRFGFSGVADTATAHNTTSGRVPFSWEQAPGKPKDTAGDTPRPKPPPCLIHPPREEANNEADADSSNNSDVALFHDDDQEEDDDDIFSDAMDVFSLMLLL